MVLYIDHGAECDVCPSCGTDTTCEYCEACLAGEAFWTPWELRDSFYALDYLEATFATLYGDRDESNDWNASCN